MVHPEESQVSEKIEKRELGRLVFKNVGIDECSHILKGKIRTSSTKNRKLGGTGRSRKNAGLKINLCGGSWS